MLDTYSKVKTELSNVLSRLKDVAVSENTKTRAQLLISKLEADVFSLVVVGQFKRGKTTFINALLGRDFLPMAIIPLTSVITILNYGKKLRIIIFFDNDAQKEITVDDLPLYVTEKNNPKNEKGVNRVEILYPSQYLKNGVRIIDTPGVASIHEHNTKTTYQYLPNADAAIFLVNADPPLSQAELHFLRDIKNAVTKVFFILNKIDTVSDNDLQESLAFTKKVIEEQAKFNNSTIFPVSAKEALEGKMKNDLRKINKSGLRDFERALDRFLMNEKGNILLRSITGKAANLLDEEMLLAELEEKSVCLPLKELENKIEIFKTFLRDINQERIDNGRLFQEEIRALQKEVLEDDIEKFKPQKTKWLIAKIDEFTRTHHQTGNTRFAELIDTFISAHIEDLFSTWRIEEEKILKKHIEGILGRLVKRMNGILEQIVSSSTELFGISGREFRIHETLPPEIEFRFQTKDEDHMLSIISHTAKKMLPKIFAHKLIHKEARNKAVTLIDRHCGKLRYDFTQRMEELVHDYRSLVEDTVESAQKDILKAVGAGLKAKQKTAAEITGQEAILHHRFTTLKTLKESIQQVKTHL